MDCARRISGAATPQRARSARSDADGRWRQGATQQSSCPNKSHGQRGQPRGCNCSSGDRTRPRAPGNPSPLNRIKREAIFEWWQKANPQPTTELAWRNPFELLVAVILSAQATDKSVNRATNTLFAAAPDPRSMLALGEDGIAVHIRHIGLYRAKAKHLTKTCARLLAEHGGEVPSSREELETLPGVGRKTANVVLNTAFGALSVAVDTHIFRVANRTGLAPGKTPLEVERKLLRMIPRRFLKDAHHWMILHGRYVCKARKPDCPACGIRELCDYRSKTPSPAETEAAQAQAR